MNYEYVVFIFVIQIKLYFYGFFFWGANYDLGVLSTLSIRRPLNVHQRLRGKFM